MLTHSWIKMICLCLLPMALPAQAAITATELQALQNNAHRATTQMMMYVILERPADRKTIAMAHLREGEASIDQIGDAALKAKWQALQANVTKGPYSNNKINTHAIFELENSAIDLAAAIRTRMPVTLPRHQKSLYELVDILQMMAIIYLRNNADPQGGSGFFSANSNMDLAVQQQKFSSKIDGLINAYPKLGKSLSKTHAKWKFLANGFSDYNTKSVPFIVDFYSHQIIEDLLAVAAEQP